MSLKAEEVCFCGHGKWIHQDSQVYSKATDSHFRTDLCSARYCKCKHFKRTTFVPSTKSFDLPLTGGVMNADEQLELFG